MRDFFGYIAGFVVLALATISFLVILIGAVLRSW